MDPDNLMLLRGDSIKQVRFGKTATFELNAPGFSRDAVDVTVLSPTRTPLSYRLIEQASGQFLLEFSPSEVGSHYVDITVAGRKMSAVAKVYNPSLIRILELSPGLVGTPVQFKVDASSAGEGQLEISVNEGELPNQVRVLGGGTCLVSFTPEMAKHHLVDIKFNGETVPGCPIPVQVSDSKQVSVNLQGLELVPVGVPARFQISLEGKADRPDLNVTVQSPNQNQLPVKLTSSGGSFYTAEFTPMEVGPHTVVVQHSGAVVPPTPFNCKAHDAGKVYVSPLPKALLGRPLTFTVDASQAGEGNLEITITGAKGRNVSTQVAPMGGARFNVSFTPLEPVDHRVSVTFNKIPVQGSPFLTPVSAEGQVVVSGPCLASTPVGRMAEFTISNVSGSLDDVEVRVEGGPSSAPRIPIQILQGHSPTSYRVQFTPKVPGEHRIVVLVRGLAISGSPFACKVYDVSAIKVKDTEKGVLGRPVTFLVETTQAGPGNLEVTVNGGQVPTSAQAQGSHTYAISFTPKEARDHMIELKFNGENVPGSPFRCDVIDATKYILKGDLEKVRVGSTARIQIEPATSLLNETPEVRVIGPMKTDIPAQVTRESDGKFSVEYIPVDVGDHVIHISVSGVPLPASPLTVKSYDSSKVRVTPPITGNLRKPVYFAIDASTAGAGNLEIIVSVMGRNVPNYVQAEGNAKFRVNFTPTDAALHAISVKFNGEPVPGSPYNCRVGDPERAVIEVPKSAPIKEEVVIPIDPRGSQASNLNILVLTPSGSHLPVTLGGALPEKVIASFVPTEVGPHSVTISMDGSPMPGSPFNLNIYDTSRIRLSGLRKGFVGKPVTFTVDASTAGEGTLELVVTTGKQSLRAEVSARSRGLYDVTFVPLEALTHFVNVTFNELEVPGSPWECGVEEEPYSTVSEPRAEPEMVSNYAQVLVGTLAFFEAEKKADLGVRVLSPQGDKVKVKVTSSPLGLLRAEWVPVHTGQYKVLIESNGKTVKSLSSSVFDPLLVKVKELKESLLTGQETSFIVDTSRCGLDPSEAEKSLAINITNGLGQIASQVDPITDHICRVIFTPLIPVTHKVNVLLSNFSVKGSPYPVSVLERENSLVTGSSLYLARLSKPATFTILTGTSTGRDFDVVISGPGGLPLPVRCYQQKDGNLRAEFTPSTVGSHEIALYYRSKMIKGAPFPCQVFDPKGIDLILPDGPRVGERVDLPVNLNSAGKALLEAEMTGPEGVVKTLFLREKGRLEFVPILPGKYKVALFYGQEPVPGSPFCINVEEASAPAASGTGLTKALVGKRSKFIVSGVAGMPTVEIEGPETSAEADLFPLSSGKFEASYVPQEIGVFDVRILSHGVDIPGSPFHPRVVDPSKIRVIGGWSAYTDKEGFIPLTPGAEKKIAFNLTDAGPGVLEAVLTNERGEPVPDACKIEGSSSGKAKLILPGNLARGEYNFTLLYGGFPVDGTPNLVSVSGESEDPLEKDDYSLAHSSNSIPNPASLVLCTGEGLKVGTLNKDIRSFIDTRRAGPGELTAHCQGPRKTAYCELYDHGDGTFTLNVKPVEAGKHALAIKYSGQHVPGSPFPLKVVGLPDPSKVKVYGPGVEHGVLATFQSRFICDTRGAGAGQLTVRVRGPKGAFRVEMQRESQKDRTILCKFDPTEPGDYRVETRWAGEHVPGSPFTVMIFDTQEELRGYLEGGHSGPMAAPSEFYGSTTYSMSSWRGSRGEL